MSGPSFREIEHKYVVDDDFDVAAFRRTWLRRRPVKTTSLAVRDVYYATAHQPGHIYRHRYDRELQHLTVKSLEADAEVRLEVNLDLGQHRGDQQTTVEAFMATLDVVWRGEIHKEIEVFYFPDCEVVYYEATAASGSVTCVELEAIGAPSIDEAKNVLEKYAAMADFDPRRRTKQTLVEILFPSDSR